LIDGVKGRGGAAVIEKDSIDKERDRRYFPVVLEMAVSTRERT
jgi:hypothetical protein